ncbi:MAG TPA: hypothetical protein VF411_09970 [Bacteroidia bacterium]
MKRILLIAGLLLVLGSNAFSQSKTKAERTIVVVIEDYKHEDGTWYLSMKQENGEYASNLEFKYAKDSSLIINPEAKDLFFKNKKGHDYFNTKYKGKKARISFVKENYKIQGDGIISGGIVTSYVITKINCLN